MSAANFEFNGLMDSILPNVYINRITLERLDSQSPSSNKYDMTPHINTQSSTGKNISAPHHGGAGYNNVLKVTLDMFLEIPNVDDNDFWNMIFSEDMVNYLSIRTQFYSGKTGKKYYMMEMGQQPPDELKALLATLDLPEGVTPPSYAAMNLTAHEALGHYGQEKQNAAKKKYKELLPDGTSVFKIPIRTVTHISDASPTDLAVIAYCTIDFESLVEDLVTASGGSDSPDFGVALGEAPRGRRATEVIIKDKEIQGKGMIFYVSNQQGDNGKTFDHLKGQIWLGDVHKSGDRYMTGKEHSPLPHPFLDYVVVPNNRIQDFRQVVSMQKQLVNFTPVTDLVFGGSYSKNIAVKSLDSAAIFSNLISSTTQDGKVKLFFNIDWGRLIKKHCAVPALIDKLAGTPKLQGFFTGAHWQDALSFKIFREQIGVPHNIVNQNNRELIYDNFPKIFYIKKPGVDLLPISSLVPISLYTDTQYNGFVKSYSFTDYRKDPSAQQIKPGKAWTNSPRHISGKFKYSIEMVVHDPTIPYLIEQLGIAQTAVDVLKNYTRLANGHGSEAYWNGYLGKFNEKFYKAKPHWPTLLAAIKVFGLMASLFRSDYTSSAAEIETADVKETATEKNLWVKWGLAIYPMITPDTATPESIATAYEIFTTLTSQLRKIIESFSTAMFPKESAGADAAGNKILQQFTKTPVGSDLPQRKIKIEHTFDDPTEIVDTTNMLAGHDIFAHVPNRSSYELGLKLMHAGDYQAAADAEAARYFSSKFPASVPVYFDIDHAKLKSKNIEIDANWATALGHFFTVPEDANPSLGNPLHTVLPDTIVSRDDDEFNYAMLINNIIRYKSGLFGNPDKKSFLGYEFMNDPSVADLGGIGHKMERIIKEYQSLAHQSAVFSHATNANTGKLIPPDIGTAAVTETESEDPWVASNKLPWAKDIKQERFLLALIMQDYFNLSDDDKSLAKFNTNEKSTPIGKYFNNIVAQMEVNPYGSGPITGDFHISTIKTLIKKGTRNKEGLLQGVHGGQTIPGLSALPNQIKTLIFNNIGSVSTSPAVDVTTQDKLHDSVRYIDGNKHNKLYKAQTMLASKFGEFWFKHQNLIEIEYLSSFGEASVPVPIPAPLPVGSYVYDPKTETWKFANAPGTPQASSQIQSPKRYEDTNNSSIGAPNWKPLNVQKVAAIGDTQKLLLCRLKKYRHPIFNQKVYDILDLPLYDEHFFLYFGNPQKTPMYFDASDLKTTMGVTSHTLEYIKLNSSI